MPAIHIRDVPEEVLEALKQRARRHHRSLQGELLQLLKQAAVEDGDETVLPPLQLSIVEGPEQPDWSREGIYDSDGR
jgi:plasmid stability protein